MTLFKDSAKGARKPSRLEGDKRNSFSFDQVNTEPVPPQPPPPPLQIAIQDLSREASAIESAAALDGREPVNLQREQRVHSDDNQGSLSESSRRLLASSEDHWRILWRAARNHQQADHYDYSLFGLDAHLDKAVARHQRETMLYNQGKSIARRRLARAPGS